jgi:hypothetical protein
MANNQDPNINAQNAQNTERIANATEKAAKNQQKLKDAASDNLFIYRDLAYELERSLKTYTAIDKIQSRELLNAFKKQADYVKDINNSIDDLLDGTSDLADLEEKIEKGRKLQSNLLNEQDQLLSKVLANNQNNAEIVDAIVKAKNGELEILDLIEKRDLKISENEKDILKLLGQQTLEYKQQAEVEGKLLERTKNIKDATGLTGDVLKSANEAMKELGLSSLASAFNFDKAAAAGKKLAAELTANGEKPLNTAGRIKVLQASLSELGKGFVKNITSFEAIAAFALKSAIEASKQTAELRKETGMSYTNAYLLKQEMSGVALASGDAFVTTEKLMKAAASLTNELGMSAQVLGNDALISATNLEQKLGFSAKESATLVTNARLQSKDTEKVLENNIKIVGEFNKQNKTALNVNKVLKEAAGASMGLQANLGFSNDKLIKAAAAATKLGLSLSEVQGVADSLLNFESSIEAELEAELLTGKDINLEKERQLALAGDLEGLSKSLNDNAIIQDAFASKNVIKQEAIAKAMGINRDQLAKITLQQKFNNMAAEDFKRIYGDTTYESMKTQNATEKLQNVLNKVLDILGSIVSIFSPLIDLVAWFASSWVGIGTILTIIAFKTIPAMVSGFSSMAKSIAGMVKGIGGLFTKEGLGEAKDKIKGFFGGDKTKEMANKAGDGAEAAADKTKGITNQAGKNIKNFLTNLSKGIQSFKLVEFKDIGKLAATAGALAVMTLAVPALLALAAIGIPAGKGLTALGKGIKSFGKSMEALGPVGLAYAAVGLALLTGALIGIGFALNLAAPAIEAFGKVITSIFDGLATLVTSVAEGFVILMDSLSLDKIGNLILLGPALLSASVGLGAFAIALAAAGVSSFFGGGIIDQIVVLAEMAGPLQTTASALTQMATALMGVANALNQIDTDKLDSLNEFATTNSIGNAVGGIVNAITAPIQALGNVIGGGNERDNELAEIKSVLQQILAKETNIYLDTTKVGTGFAMGTSKVQ